MNVSIFKKMNVSLSPQDIASAFCMLDARGQADCVGEVARQAGMWGDGRVRKQFLEIIRFWNPKGREWVNDLVLKIKGISPENTEVSDVHGV